MDRHFVDTNPRHNMPVVLALVDLWNDAFLNSRGRNVSPYSQAFDSYPGFVAVLENKVLKAAPFAAKPGPGSGRKRTGPSPVVDGAPGLRDLPTEFIMSLAPPSPGPGIPIDNGVALAEHDKRVCSLFAHADVLAFGDGHGSGQRGLRELSSPGSPPAIQSVDSVLSHSCGGDAAGAAGDRPSTLLLCDVCDAFACGQLVALAEHRALVKAWLWDVDPFQKHTTPSTKEERQEHLTNKLQHMYNLLSMGTSLDEANSTPLSKQEAKHESDNKATILTLKHYATLMPKHRCGNRPT